MATLARIITGTVTLPANTASVNVTLPSAVDLAKTFHRSFYSVNNATGNGGCIRSQLTTTTNLLFQRPSASSVPAVSLRYFVLEFSDGVTVQRGNITAVSDIGTERAADVTVSAVDLTKTFPIFTAMRAGSGFGFEDQVIMEMTSTTNLRMTSGDGGTPSAFTHSWELVTYDDCVVTTGTATFPATDTTLDLTIPQHDKRSTLIIPSATYYSGDPYWDETAYTAEIIDGTTLRYQRQVVSPNTGRVRYHLVRFTDGVTVQHVPANFGSGDTARNYGLSVGKNAVPFFSGFYGKGGKCSLHDDNWGAVYADPLISNKGLLTLTRALSGSTLNANCQIIDFTKSRRGSGAGFSGGSMLAL